MGWTHALRRLWTPLALGLSGVMVLTACNSGGASAPSSGAPAATSAPVAQPKTGGAITLALGADFRTLDPHNYGGATDTNVLQMVYENLLKYDYNLKLQPALAESWTHPDPLTYNFKLRQNVKFHDGTPFNAAAAKFSFERAGKAAPVMAYLGDVASIETTGEYDLTFKMKRVRAGFLETLTFAPTGIVSPAAVQKFDKDFGVRADTAIGTGPFTVKERTPRERTVLVRNDTYWGQKSYLDQVTWRPIAEESTRLLAFEAGEIDAVFNPSPQRIDEMQKAGKFDIIVKPGNKTIFIALNHSDPNLADLKVRQAIIAAIDRDALVKNVVEGKADVAGGFISPPMGASVGGVTRAPLPKYDVARAKQLLQEAGKSNLKIDMFLSPNGRYLRDKEIGEAVQQQLKAAGIEANFQVLELAAFFDAHYAFKNQLSVLGWGGDAVDPWDPLFRVFYSTSNLNFSKYNNKDFDALMDKAVTTEDNAVRKKTFEDIEKLLVDTAAYVPIYHEQKIWAVNKRVKNLGVVALEQLYLNETWVER